MNPQDNAGLTPAFAALKLELQQAATQPRRAESFGRDRRIWTAGLATLVIVVGVSPAGAAIAGALGDLVGIGDEPTNPQHQTAVVVGTGTANSYPYELVASSKDDFRTEAGHGSPTPCLFVDFPSVSSAPAAGNCLTSQNLRALQSSGLEPIAYGAPQELDSDAEIIVQGLTSPQAADVEVSYTDSNGEVKTAPVSLGHLDETMSA